MAWWAWCIGGFVLLAGEIFAPTGFFLFIIGMGALIVGGILALGLELAPSMQLLAYGVITFILMFSIRKPLLGLLKPGTPATASEIEGSEIIVSNDIPPGAEGTGELRGVVWRIRNTGQGIARGGNRYRVDRAEGFLLHIQAS